jgi:hypothetical protein
MKAGISGHQVINPPSAATWVVAVMGKIVDELDISVGFTSLAKGPDQIFAEILLRKKVPFVAIIPSHDYGDTFETPDDLSTFIRLRYAAIQEVQLGFERLTPQAFLNAGKEVVDRSDFLIAVWDGRPANGSGVTADIVTYSQLTGKKVLQLNPVDRTIKTV